MEKKNYKPQRWMKLLFFYLFFFFFVLLNYLPIGNGIWTTWNFMFTCIEDLVLPWQWWFTSLVPFFPSTWWRNMDSIGCSWFTFACWIGLGLANPKFSWSELHVASLHGSISRGNKWWKPKVFVRHGGIRDK